MILYITYYIIQTHHFTHTGSEQCTNYSIDLDYIDSFSNDTQNSTTYGINLCLDNVYGTICANGFTNAIANLICKQNGYEGMIILITLIVCYN